MVGREPDIFVDCVEKGVAIMAFVRGARLALGLAKAEEGTTAGFFRAAKLRTASRRPSGAFEESAEESMLCPGTERVMVIQLVFVVFTTYHQSYLEASKTRSIAIVSFTKTSTGSEKLLYVVSSYPKLLIFPELPRLTKSGTGALTTTRRLSSHSTLLLALP